MSYDPFDREQVDKWMRAMPGSFRDWLLEQHRSEVAVLLSASDLLHVGRAQGRLEIWDYVIKLREGT